jgi:hypothetical protein
MLERRDQRGASRASQHLKGREADKKCLVIQCPQQQRVGSGSADLPEGHNDLAGEERLGGGEQDLSEGLVGSLTSTALADGWFGRTPPPRCLQKLLEAI